MAVPSGVTLGTTLDVSQYYGAKDMGMVMRVIGNSTNVERIGGVLRSVAEELFYHQQHEKLACRQKDHRVAVYLGFPSMIQQSLASVSYFCIVGSVNGFGSAATAGFTAAQRIEDIAFLPLSSFGMASPAITGQNIGDGKIDRIKEL
jgi:Na+-driven multidrug efflux pump